MKVLVVDASVAAKWFLPEDHAQEAVRLLGGRFRLLAPDLIWTEFANIIWKNHLRGTIAAGDANDIVSQFLSLPLEVHASSFHLLLALQLAMQTRRTAYDCTYLALALNENAALVTADQRLVNALAHSPFADRIQHVARAGMI